MMATSFAIAGSVVFLLPPWDLSLLASGAYKYAPYIDAADLETELRAVAACCTTRMARLRPWACDSSLACARS